MSQTGIIRSGALALIVLSAPICAQGIDPSFSPAFGSNMVLPHDAPVMLSGRSAPDAVLRLTVDGGSVSFRSDGDGRWQTRIGPLGTGGPYAIELRDDRGRSATLSNVLAGEIWLCSGQSNMAYSVAAASDRPDDFQLASPLIRLLSIPQLAELESQPEFDQAVGWQTADNASVPRFSAVCYFAARDLSDRDGVPRGLVNASWGGSAIEAWVSEGGLAGIADFGRKVQQLQQFRQDRRGAELAFADDWVAWWQSSSDQGPVWERGVLDTTADWRDAPLVNWKTYPDERLSNHHGIVWFSTRFELTESQSRRKASFVLGKIDEVDTTWINGEFVNNTFGYGSRREYPLEDGVLRAGANQITVNVLNTWDVGGMLGPADDVGIRLDDGEFIPLGSGWKYRFIPRATGQPPRSPWESVAGVSGMFNGMIAPLAALRPAAVLWYQGESNVAYSESYGSLLSALVADWRRHFDDPALPFVVVQLPNYGEIATEPGASGWATIRNAQQQVAVADDRVGLVVTHDVGNDADIHPRQKFIVGARAAAVVRALRGQGGAEDGIVASIAGTGDGHLMLGFSAGLEPAGSGNGIDGFSLCDRDASRCVFTAASLVPDGIAVALDPMPEAGLVRYCWSDGGECGLQSVDGLPLSSFELEL